MEIDQHWSRDDAVGSYLTQTEVNTIIAGYSDQFPLPFVLVVCGYAFILLIDKVIIDSHSSLIGHVHGGKASSDEVGGENAEEAEDEELNAPEDDIKDALERLKMRKKSSSVASARPTLDHQWKDMRKGSNYAINDRHIHNEDCHRKRKSRKQIQKEMLEESLQSHFKKTDKFSGAMKNLIDEHKREVKRIRI